MPSHLSTFATDGPTGDELECLSDRGTLTLRRLDDSAQQHDFEDLTSLISLVQATSHALEARARLLMQESTPATVRAAAVREVRESVPALSNAYALLSVGMRNLVHLAQE